MNGFLGIDAPATANANLTVQLLMGVALLAGMMLARRQRFRAHAICQSTVVLLNLIPITTFMLPVFRRGVMPSLPAELNDPYFAVSTAHATLGTVAELLGLYIILRAGTNLLPQALRFDNYKVWMRTELTIWWLVIALGVGTYLVWYSASASSSSATAPAPESAPRASPTAPAATDSASPTAPQTVTVAVTNFAFEPKELSIEPGTTVVWKNNTGRHTAVADDNSFESPIMKAGEEFRHKFEREGRFPYYCSLHGDTGGKDMAGTITVTARSKP
jgi:plastocyanin/uncharacterized membrane protein YozB (DUF420 family)